MLRVSVYCLFDGKGFCMADANSNFLYVADSSSWNKAAGNNCYDGYCNYREAYSYSGHASGKTE